MEYFSEKSLLSLGDYYVYGLIDPRTNQIFYIGKGTGNRVFEHEKESINSPNSDKLKLKTISEIKALGLSVKKIIINSNLTETEAFAAEAALINAFNYVSDIGLTNIVAGHHSSEALSVEEFEKVYGAEVLREEDIKHKILVIKINKLYRRDIPADELYDSVRGVWRASMNNAQSVEYVFGVYNSLIVAVYKPTKWYKCKEAPEKRPRQDEILTPKTENRIFFVDEDFEKGLPHDENESFYHGKSIAGLKLNQAAQNPITYLSPKIERYKDMLFIGNSKLIKEKRSHMVQKYSEYGMKYGWLGKQGVLFVDEIVDVENYDNFFEYAKANQSSVKKLLDVKADIMVAPEEPKGNKTDKGIKKILNPMKSLPAAIVNAPIRGLNAINKMVNSKKIEEQEYSCLILVFYLQGLSKFLGLSEE